MTELSEGVADLGTERPAHPGIVSVQTRPAKTLPGTTPVVNTGSGR